VCPRLRDLATAPAGGITQPRTNFFINSVRRLSVQDILQLHKCESVCELLMLRKNVFRLKKSICARARIVSKGHSERNQNCIVTTRKIPKTYIRVDVETCIKDKISHFKFYVSNYRRETQIPGVKLKFCPFFKISRSGDPNSIFC